MMPSRSSSTHARLVLSQPLLALVLAAALTGLVACGDDAAEENDANGGTTSTNSGTTSTNNGSTGTNNATTSTNGGTTSTNNGSTGDGTLYTFESRFEPGASSVSYSGQTARHVLIADLKTYIPSLSGQIDRGTFTPTDDGDVVAALDFYFRFDSDSNGEETPLLVESVENAQQQSYNAISTNKDLVGKLAGNDSVTDYVDWTADFAGWSDDGIAQYGGSTSSPEGLVVAMFETLEENAINRANGVLRTGPDGEQLPVHVTDKGVDLNQLINKFLLGAIAFHQAADDYTDDDVPDKGLLASNARSGDAAYSGLEHAWDEAFGYFGAARDYALYTDEELAQAGGRDAWQGAFDTDSDGTIDLTSEYNFGASTNAAKRDLGASTDMTQDAIEGFVKGRALIAASGDTLTEAELTELRGWRDQAIGAWERAIAATAIHYVNDTLEDMSKIGTDAYSFADHAKHWSELKGFALSFQFNPNSPMRDDFAQLHQLLGDAPVFEADGLDAYSADLLQARDLMRDAYGFAAADAESW